MFKVSKNKKKLDQYGTGDNKFFCHRDFWDCECPDSKPYIHAKSKGNFCPACNTFEEQGMPDSRLNEIEEKYNPELDTSIHKEYKE